MLAYPLYNWQNCTGASRVIAGDVRESRLRLAKKYTPYILNLSHPDRVKKFLELNNGKLADVLIEFSGNPALVDTIPDYIKPGGRIHLLGQYREPVIITRYARWNNKDLRISCSIALNPSGKEEILSLISQGEFDAKSLYTTIYHIDDTPKAYKELEENRDILKILLRWE
ncbi:zinc-binding dehydrogenase [bacterium]|nr:zinc-binding dehydrogenase [bacterium]